MSDSDPGAIRMVSYRLVFADPMTGGANTQKMRLSLYPPTDADQGCKHGDTECPAIDRKDGQWPLFCHGREGHLDVERKGLR